MSKYAERMQLLSEKVEECQRYALANFVQVPFYLRVTNVDIERFGWHRIKKGRGYGFHVKFHELIEPQPIEEWGTVVRLVFLEQWPVLRRYLRDHTESLMKRIDLVTREFEVEG